MDLISSLAGLDLSVLQQPPLATFFILGLVSVISLATTLLNRRVMNLDEYKKMMIESNRVRKEVMEAMRSGNQRAISKAQNKQQELMKAQQQMSSQRMKISLYTLIPILVMWQVLLNFFRGVIVAYMPFKAPFLSLELNVGGWYILCSFATSIVLQRVLGLTFEIGPED